LSRRATTAPVPPSTLDELVTVLRHYGVRGTGEREVQDGLALIFQHERIAFEREVALTPEDRIDFLVGAIGVEVKIKGGPSAVLEQLTRYAQHDRVRALLLVTQRVQLANLGGEIDGKPLRTLAVWRGLV